MRLHKAKKKVRKMWKASKSFLSGVTTLQVNGKGVGVQMRVEKQ